MHTEKTKLHFDKVFGKAIEYSDLKLYQVGDCFTKTGFCVNEHPQKCDEISYVVSGEAEFWLNDTCYKLKAGDLFFCPKGSVHKIVSTVENPVRYYYIGYTMRKDSANYEQWSEVDAALKALKEPVFRGAFNMNHLFNDLLCEFQQEFDKAKLMVELCACQIVLYTYKYFTYNSENAAVYQKRVPSKRELAYEIVNYIDNNILRIRNLKDISRYIGFSYSYTSQIFCSVMNTSLSDYYQKKRFEEAVKLLKSGTNVIRTAEILGFDSINSFSRAFKNRFGASPQKYVKNLPADNKQDK